MRILILLLVFLAFPVEAGVRKDVIRDVWGQRTLPDVLPKRVGNKLVLKMKWGFTSVSTILYPKRWNGEYVIVHAGHQSNGWREMKDVIGKILGKGYRVVAMNMPLTGDNKWPSHLKFPEHANHNLLANLPGENLQLFLMPIVAVVNYLEEHRVHMTGVSGGGWATSVACGIDRRIDVCVSVAGDIVGGAGGDYEQIHPIIVDRYIDLWIAAGCSGKKITVLHRGDPYIPFDLSYEKYVKKKVAKCGGIWRLRTTNLGKHGYGEKATRVLLKAL